jgi:hypothetical protein
MVLATKVEQVINGQKMLSKVKIPSIVTANGTLTAIGGGYGGTGPWNHTLKGQAGSGGSGGGASGYNAGTSGRNGSGTAGQGNAGASGYNSHVGGGGGGAGGAGSTGRSHYASKGGDGIENCILGTCYYWAGGGGAAGHSYFGGHGGKGGGGGGGSYNAGGTVIAGGNGLNTGTVGGVGRNKPVEMVELILVEWWRKYSL